MAVGVVDLKRRWVFRVAERRPAKARPNALQLRGCDFDGCGAVVADLSMLGVFDGPVAGAVAFDDAGVGVVAAFPVGVGEDFSMTRRCALLAW
jgi:hypothetical protein